MEKGFRALKWISQLGCNRVMVHIGVMPGGYSVAIGGEKAMVMLSALGAQARRGG